jgi:hypothetical protein
MYVVLTDQLWCENHAVLKEDGWECKTTGADIQVTVVGRSLHDGPFPLSGSGRVIQVGHLHCPKCNPGWKAPEYGTPIKPDAVAEAS